MSASELLQPIIQEILGQIENRRPLRLTGLQAGGKPWLLSILANRWPTTLVVVTESLAQAESLRDDLDFFGVDRPVMLFPHWDTVPYDGFSPNADWMGLRFRALAALLDQTPVVLVTTVQSWMQGMIPPSEFQLRRFTLRPGERHPRRELLERLIGAGYVRVDLVEAPGEFSARGDIVDIFPVHEEHPLRLDFFDDDLETIRRFQVDSQKSFGEVSSVMVFPASEIVITQESASRARRELPHHKGQLQPDYYRQLYHYLEQGTPFPGCEQMMGLFYEKAGWLHDVLPDDAVVVVDEPQQLENTARSFHEEVLGEQELSLRQGNLALPAESFYLAPSDFQNALGGFYRMQVQALRLEGEGVVCPFSDNSGLRGAAAAEGKSMHASLEQILKQMVAWRDEGAQVVLATRSETGAERLRQVLAEYEVGSEVIPSDQSGQDWLRSEPSDDGFPTDFRVLTRTPNKGFRLIDESGHTRFALITETEMLGEKTRQRRLKKSKLQHFIASLGELKEGDLVVHVEYGIGRYEGLRRLKAGGGEGDFLHLSYAEGDKVYVPVSRLNQVQKFTGMDETAPQLSRLGDGAWQRSKARASKAIEDMAEELISVQAARKARKGHKFPPNTALLTEFEEAFSYQETEDQQTAIDEVLQDLMNEEPMDRLVCGDVGFGKTEVAMRAAYLTVLDGLQVMMLVPTTILAQQHYNTFTKRFEAFPIVVDVLSRFRTAGEQKKIVRTFSEGKVDVLIGTHRLLSKDVLPKNLGLLVIDEEQRFGVAHKEKIKHLKNEVEVVTLSATPIPRTLHMSLMGVRDLSIINTPPMDRIAVRTRLVKASDYIIAEAVEREVRRGGQVFVVQNRIENIHQFATYVHSLVPHHRLGVAHGQMPEKQLEDVMMDFVSGELEILVSTSIIESGLDIPRANTIIINNADHFGLAQLYQLRGRVGRSNVQAYAYLLVSPEKLLTEVAQKRLTLLQELNDLGSGFKIASHDMEIRGAGNLLGREQSGYINTIGLELFTRMVEEAISKLKEGPEARVEAIDCKLELGFPYLLPEDFITGTRQRLEVYKQLAEVSTEQEAWEIRQTLEDRFGKIPPGVATLFVLIRIRLIAIGYGLSALENSRGRLVARFGRPERVDLERLMALVADPDNDFQLKPGDRLVLGTMPSTPDAVIDKLMLLESVVRRDRAAA